MQVSLERYPGYRGALDVRGVLVVGDATDASSGAPSVALSGTLAGLPASSSGGYHVHTGTSCADAASVFGHYFGGDSDPWAPLRYASDGAGVVALAPSPIEQQLQPGSSGVLVPGYTLDRAQPVASRAVVVHDPSGARVACGLIGVRPPLAGASLASGYVTLARPLGEGFTMIDLLEELVADVNADWIDVLIVWMAVAGPGLTTFFTVLIVATATVSNP